jgi:hypothetical protein
MEGKRETATLAAAALLTAAMLHNEERERESHQQQQRRTPACPAIAPARFAASSAPVLFFIIRAGTLIRGRESSFLFLFIFSAGESVCRVVRF